MSDFLDRAVTAHVQWKIKLLGAVNGGTIPDRQTACTDDHCELGKWLRGEGQQFKDLIEYKELAESHRRFHISVGKVIDMVTANRIADAKHELASGEYAMYSTNTVLCITRLKAISLSRP